MTARRPLRSVSKDESAARKAPNTVLDATERGSRLEVLILTRRRVAEAIDHPNTTATALAALTKRLMDIVYEIEQLQAGEDEDDHGTTGSEPSGDAAWEAI